MSGETPAKTKLASIPVGAGREAVIWRDDKGLTRWTAGVDAWVTSTGPPYAPLLVPVDDGTLVAGEMLAGAESVEVAGPVEAREIVVAGGRYLALVPEKASAEEVFVLMRDRAGAIVPWPVEEELKRTRLSDADAQCPACGSRAWDVVERRADPTAYRYRMRAALCHTCGWYDGYWRAVGRRRRRDHDVDEAFPQSPLSEDPTRAEILNAAGFPVYGVADTCRGCRTLRQYGWEEDRVVSVVVGYERRTAGQKVEITVESRGPEQHGFRNADRAKFALRNAIERELHLKAMDEGRSIEATDLRWRELRRPVLARIERARIERASISVGGSPTEFSVVRDNGVAAAATAIDGVNLLILCRGQAVEKVELTEVLRPDDYFSPEGGHTG